jgi:uncharacterized protein YqfA (UPF0365 family)
MGQLINRVNDELAALAAKEAALDANYAAVKAEIATRRDVLTQISTQITPRLEKLVEILGIEVNG